MDKHGCKYINGKKVRLLLCQAILCSLIITGCSHAEYPYGQSLRQKAEQNQASRQQDADKSQSPSQDQGAVQSEERATAQPPAPTQSSHETAREILARLLSDRAFQIRVWYDAGIEEGDSEETILMKMNECESLTLKKPSSKVYVSSLEDLSLLPNLKSLTIDSVWDAKITDFSPIEGLSRLEELCISYDKEQEIDLSFLANMKTVKNLFLPGCNLKDISFLEEMPQLERLSLYETSVKDFSPLGKLSELVELSLGGCRGAEHIEVIGTLTKMEDLGLQYCGIEDISFLSGLSELRGVNLNGNLITDLTPLAGLKKLERLGLAENKLEDITPIKGLTGLFDLVLDRNTISDISALAGMTRLNQIGLTNNRITDLSPLADKKDLMYAAVYDNPCADLRPVLQVPLLSFNGNNVTDEDLDFLNRWLAEKHPEIESFTCIDACAGDLNEDGREDLAFVLEALPEKSDSVYDQSRSMLVLVKKEDGSYTELEDTPYIGGKGSGGVRGDPYRAVAMGKGYLALKTGWGSSTGETDITIYTCAGSRLQKAQTTAVADCNFSAGYYVRVSADDDGSWLAYAIAMDGYRMVRVDLADSAHPAHEAFPDIDLYNMSYYINLEKAETELTSAEALDSLQKSMFPEAVREELHYEPWQKKGYETLKGVELPEYYYSIPGTEELIRYDGLTFQDDDCYHAICCTGSGSLIYLVNDATGEITKR